MLLRLPYSAIADDLLRRGYRVRGATRNLSKAAPLEEKFANLYGQGKFETVELKDLTSKEEWLGAVKGILCPSGQLRIKVLRAE